MAAALPWVATGLGLFGAASSVSAANKAEDAARANAAAQRAETAEEARRLQSRQRETEARTRAAVAASGAGFGSDSQTAFKNRMSKEHSRELQWLKKSGNSRARVIEKQGAAAKASGMANVIGSLASTAGSAYGYFGPSGG